MQRASLLLQAGRAVFTLKRLERRCCFFLSVARRLSIVGYEGLNRLRIKTLMYPV